jgi:adenylate cyclase
MARLTNDLRTETREIVIGTWTRRDGQIVPEPENLALSNESADFDATFLYADLADSTELAIAYQQVAAEVCKAYLRGTTRIIRDLEGEIRSFDGDRVMGVFMGSRKNSNAAEAALKINYFFRQILVPAFKNVYTSFALNLNHGVGVDTGRVMVVRGGIRNNNDLVWVGRAPNIAAKLSGVREFGYSSYITKDVFEMLSNSSKISSSVFGNPPNTLMWEEHLWLSGVGYGVGTIYRSGWDWTP